MSDIKENRTMFGVSQINQDKRREAIMREKYNAKGKFGDKYDELKTKVNTLWHCYYLEGKAKSDAVDQVACDIVCLLSTIKDLHDKYEKLKKAEEAVDDNK